MVRYRFSALFCAAALALVFAAPGCRKPSPPQEAEAPPVTREGLVALLAGDAEELIVERGNLRDDDFALIAEHPTLTRVEVRSNAAPLGDAALAHLAKLPDLTWINLPGGNVTDAGMAEVAKLPRLRILNLHRTKITDAGLEAISQLKELELLRFGSPHVTDVGIEHISAIKSLRFLHLIDVPITDAGLVHIEAMPQLESFYIDGGNATDEGLSALITVRPNLHLHLDQKHLYDDPRHGDHDHGDGHDHGHDHGEGHGHSHQ